ncbi:MAG: YihY/virulence factor BrkB family protein [Chloroflexota bacterium]
MANRLTLRSLVGIRNSALFLKRTVQEFTADNCHLLAAAVSYYVLFSLFPLALAAIAVMGFMLSAPEAEARVLEAMSNLLPVSQEFILSTVRGVVRARGATGIVAFVGLLVAGMSVFNALRRALNAAWGVRQPRPFVYARLFDFAMMLATGLLLIVSITLTTAEQMVPGTALSLLGSQCDAQLFYTMMVVAVSTGLEFTVFLLFFRFVPNAPVTLNAVWKGALVAAVAFEGSKHTFVWAVKNFAQYNVVYGPIAALVTLLVWTYLAALILLFVARLTSRLGAPDTAEVTST